jgi:WhiB family redox-sensing transcriptional regulator
VVDKGIATRGGRFLMGALPADTTAGGFGQSGLRESLLKDEHTNSVDLFEVVSRSRPAFHADAACKEAPLRVSWFPAPGQDARAAKKICSGCLVATECAAWALAQGADLEGIWGGLTRRERAKLRASALSHLEVADSSTVSKAITVPEPAAVAFG